MSVPSDEVERLIAELKDDRRDVRSRAAYELGKHTDPRAVDPLIDALSDNDKFVRSWAAGALGKLGPHSIEPLVAVMRDAEAGVACYAGLALAELGDYRAVPALAAALREGDHEIRPGAAEALSKFGAPDDLPDTILTCETLTPAERAAILASLHGVVYSDDTLKINYNIANAAEYCKDRSQSENDAVRMASVAVLQAIHIGPAAATRDSAVNSSAATAPATEVTPAEAVKEPTAPGAGAGAVPPTVSAEKPNADPATHVSPAKKSLWERLTGR